MHTVAVVSNTSWSLYNFRLNLMKFLSKEGYRIIGIAPSDEYTEKIPFPVFPVEMNRRGTNPIQELYLIKQYRQILRNQQVDIMLNFTAKPNIWGTLAAEKENIFAINNIAGLGNTFTQKGPLTVVMKNLYRFSQKKASHIFFQNDEDLNLFKKALILKNQTYSLLPGSGVDTERFIPDHKKKKQMKVKFLMMARLLKHKGVMLYAEAAQKALKEYPDSCEFQLLGPLDPGNPSGISSLELEKIRSAGVNYLGETSDTTPFLANADCFVLPTYYREGTPKSVLEALSMGLPVITTQMPGCRDTVQPGKNGWLIAPQDQESLNKAISDFLSLNEQQIEELGQASRQLALDRFDEKIVLNKYLEILLGLNTVT